MGSGWCLTQKLTAVQSAENEARKVLSHKWDINITCPPKAQGPSLKSGQKDYNSQRSERTQGKECLFDLMGPSHSWTRQLRRLSKTTGEQWPVGSFWGRESHILTWSRKVLTRTLLTRELCAVDSF